MRVRKPVHFAFYGAGHGRSACGLVGGRNGKGYKRYMDSEGKYRWETIPCDVPFARITVKFEKVTCEDCLVLVVNRAKKQLHARLRAIGSVKLQRVVRKAHARLAVGALREVVDA